MALGGTLSATFEEECANAVNMSTIQQARDKGNEEVVITWWAFVIFA